MLSPRLASSGTGAGGGVCPLKGGGRVFCPVCPGGGGGGGGRVLPRILVTCPGSQGTSCPCSPFMIRVEVPGSSFMLCLGPGPSSLLHLTRANAEKPYAGDTMFLFTRISLILLVSVMYRDFVRSLVHLHVFDFHFFVTANLIICVSLFVSG